MVFSISHRILGNQQDAQDSVQTTFLVLVHKAKSVRPREMVGNWLYAVARQTAIRMRSQIAKRWRRERQVMVMPDPQLLPSEYNEDLYLLLDQELSRLAEKYRIAILLCELQGKTRKQAAQQLGWPEGTLSSRLARGKAMLAKRLARHGLSVSAGTLTAALFQDVASASLPPTLVSTTVKAASLLVTGKPVASGLISAKVASLAGGVMKTMLLTKLKIATAALTLFAALGVSIYGISAIASGAGQEPSKSSAPLKVQADEPVDSSKARIEGIVVDEVGKPVAGALVNMIKPLSSPAGEPVRSAADGTFRLLLEVPSARLLTLIASVDDGARQGIFKYRDTVLEPIAQRGLW